MQKVNVTIGESTVKALNIKSPVQNATIAQGTPVILLWDAPADASSLNPEIFVSANNGYTNYSALNGSEIKSGHLNGNETSNKWRLGFTLNLSAS